MVALGVEGSSCSRIEELISVVVVVEGGGG